MWRDGGGGQRRRTWGWKKNLRGVVGKRAVGERVVGEWVVGEWHKCRQCFVELYN